MGERLRGGERGQEVLGGDLRDEGDGAFGDRGRALGVQDGEADGVEEGEREEEAGERAEEDPERDAAEARGAADLRPGNTGPRRRGLRGHGLRVERLRGGRRAQREEREEEEDKGGGQERQGFGRVPARHPSSYHHETSMQDLLGETSKIPWTWEKRVKKSINAQVFPVPRPPHSHTQHSSFPPWKSEKNNMRQDAKDARSEEVAELQELAHDARDLFSQKLLYKEDESKRQSTKARAAWSLEGGGVPDDEEPRQRQYRAKEHGTTSRLASSRRRLTHALVASHQELKRRG